MNLKRMSLLGVLLVAGVTAHAGTGDFWQTEIALKSALLNTSNTIISNTRYHEFYGHSGANPDTYINSLQLIGGTNWDSRIDINLPTTTITYNTTGSYTLGTAISGDQNWFMQGPVNRGGAIDPDVAAGIYDFSVQFIGGDSSTATDVLTTMDLQIEVFDFLNIDVTGTPSPGTISAGQQSALSMTVGNNMSSREFVSTSWYVSSFSNGTDNLQFDGFDFSPDGTGWFDKHIATGGSLTRGHSFWSATASTPLGTYSGNDGVVGGLYNGDEHFVFMNPAPTINVVVPEPISLIGMSIAGIGFLSRRRKK